MALEISCGFASSPESPEHTRVAEQLGYRRAWFYDSPALYSDVWVQLCRAAERTERIGLGPGVLIPTLRHPLVTASAIATLVSLAGPDRITVGVGAGFTGRLAMGQRAIPWTDVAHYIRVVKALLHGEQTMWDGGVIQMLHGPDTVAPRPIEVPYVVAAMGPKGTAVAKELADGIFCVLTPIPGFSWTNLLVWGTVLGDGEDPASERVVAAAGPAATVLLHAAVEWDQLDMVPGGKEWAAVYDDVPDNERHLALHDGHVVTVSERDRPFVTGELITAFGLALDPPGWREKLSALEAAGVTEVTYQPCGSDIPGELERFASAARG